MSSYQFHVFVCQNKRPDGHKRGCCASKGGESLKNYLKARVKELGLEKIRINQAGCLDQCEQGVAVVVYPENTWYSLNSREEVDIFIDQHLQQQKIAADLTFTPVIP